MLCALDFLGRCFFVFDSLQAVAIFLLSALLLFRFFFVLRGSGLGGLLIAFFFFNTVPFLENEYPCSYFFFLFCLLYSTSVLKYDCTSGTVTEQLFYSCFLLRSCVPLKTELLLNTNKIQPLVFIQMRHRVLFILGNVNCPSLLPVLNLQLSNLCEL